MVSIIYPVTGTLLEVAEENVEHYIKAGYKLRDGEKQTEAQEVEEQTEKQTEAQEAPKKRRGRKPAESE